MAKQEIPSYKVPAGEPPTVGEGAADDTAEPELYLVTALRHSDGTIQVYRYLNGKEYRFHFSEDTVFRDKYRNRSNSSGFYPGKLVFLSEVDENGGVSEVTAADCVWQYDDIVRFSVDEEKGIFKIADTNYRLTAETRVYSDDREISFSEVTETDKLSVIGRDKTILSVRVTTGHGVLALLNTELFEGSFLQLDTNIYAEITSEMTMELPEGEYRLTVANNGWGGSCDVKVVRGETVSVDLDTIKGDGPKFGNIRFIFDVEEAYLFIDGKEVDYSEPVLLQYGRHRIKAACSGYAEVSKYLVVNSEEATIPISFRPSETGSSDESGDKQEDGGGTEAAEPSDDAGSADADGGGDATPASDGNAAADGAADTPAGDTNVDADVTSDGGAEENADNNPEN